jgi:hypothetical protein
MIILIMIFKIIYRRLKMKLLLLLLFVLVPVLNISCQTVGAVEDLTSKGDKTEMASKTPDSKDLDEKTKNSNSKDTAGNSKNHNSETPKS